MYIFFALSVLAHHIARADDKRLWAFCVETFAGALVQCRHAFLTDHADVSFLLHELYFEALLVTVRRVEQEQLVCFEVSDCGVSNGKVASCMMWSTGA